MSHTSSYGDGCSAARNLPFFRHYQKTFPLSKTNKTPPFKKSWPSGESKVQTPSAQSDTQATTKVPKEGQAGDWNSLRTKDVTKLHSTDHICTKKKRLRARQARVSYRRQACKACNDMKPELRRSNKLPASFQGKALPLSIPKAEDESRENQAYWLKPVKTKHLQTQTSLSSLHKASFYHLC